MSGPRLPGPEPAGPATHAANAAAMWASMAPWASAAGDADLASVDVPTQGLTRVILRRPLRQPTVRLSEALAGAAPGHSVLIEDAFGQLSLPPEVDTGTSATSMPVMVTASPPGPRTATAADVQVEAVADEDTLSHVQDLVLVSFPPRPYRRAGRMLPGLVLTRPGWRVWLARRDAEPAGAVCAYDDGVSVGVYWLVTHPWHRSRGVGRALMAELLGTYPGRVLTLTATADGQPLYTSLGFHAVSTATWHRRGG